MNIRYNMPHYSNVWREHPKTEMYCFPLQRFLGEHGLFENHPLKGETFICKETGVKYVVDNVYVHWYHGWYFMALARNPENSHGSITWNINSDLNDWSIDKYEKIINKNVI